MRFLFLSYNNFVPAVNGKKVKKSHQPEEKQASRNFSLRAEFLWEGSPNGSIGRNKYFRRVIVLIMEVIETVVILLVEILERDDGGREQRTSSTYRNIPHRRSLQ
jgi:hypothetical protein